MGGGVKWNPAGKHQEIRSRFKQKKCAQKKTEKDLHNSISLKFVEGVFLKRLLVHLV